METIAKIKTDFPAKFGVPRQSGRVEELEGLIVFEPKYRVPEALRGIEGFSHLWLIWGFSENEREGWSPTVRPPRLGGERRMGVFATRSPFRPNALGLSCVRLVEVRKTKESGYVLVVKGADLMDGTPIYDIKPYVPYTDIRQDAVGGFAEELKDYSLKVDIPNELLPLIPKGKEHALRAVLAEDPRPGYIDEPTRVFGMEFAGINVKFTVLSGVLKVQSIEVSKGD